MLPQGCTSELGTMPLCLERWRGRESGYFVTGLDLSGRNCATVFREAERQHG